MLLAVDIGNSTISIGLLIQRVSCNFYRHWIRTRAKRQIRSAWI